MRASALASESLLEEGYGTKRYLAQRNRAESRRAELGRAGLNLADPSVMRWRTEMVIRVSVIVPKTIKQPFPVIIQLFIYTSDAFVL